MSGEHFTLPLIVETWYDQSSRTAYIWFHGDLVSYADFDCLKLAMRVLTELGARHVLYEMHDVRQWKVEAIQTFSGRVAHIREKGGTFGEIPSTWV